MKKIKIRESQAYMLKDIMETESVDNMNQNPTKSYFESSNQIISTLNKLYSKVTFMTIADMVEGTAAFKEVDRQRDELYYKAESDYGTIQDIFKQMPDDEWDKYSKLDLQVDDTRGTIMKKIEALGDILDSIRSIYKVSQHFKDIKSAEI